MKRPAAPASVEDLHPETGLAVSGTRRSALLDIDDSSVRSSKRRTLSPCSRTKAASSVRLGRSEPRGSIWHAIAHYNQPKQLTILSGSDDHSAERNEVMTCKFRKFVYEDEVINRESSTYIERELFISEIDAADQQPTIYVEQRTFDSGKEVIVARELFFGEQIVSDAVYVFEGCGDEIPGNGKAPNLHLTARKLPPEEFAEYERQNAKYFGYDTRVNLKVFEGQFGEKEPRVYMLNKDRSVSSGLPFYGVSVSGKHETDPPELKGIFPDRDIQVINVKLLGLGETSADGVAKGDLDLVIRLEPGPAP